MIRLNCMVRISYQRSITLLDSLKKIEELKKSILLALISPKTEVRLKWEATINRLYYALGLFNVSLSKQGIIKLVTSPPKKKLPASKLKILNYKKALDFITQNWLVSRFPVTINTASTINDFVCDGKLNSQKKESLQKCIDFLTAGPENPIIQAAIIHIQIITTTPFANCNQLTAQLLSLLYLYKYGYNFRNLIVLEEYWSKDIALYKKSAQAVTQKENLTPWLEYFTQGLVTQLEKILKKIKSQRLEIPVSANFWKLNDRQKKILTLLQEPNSTITNKKVQKLFKVSQITASRDLSKLASLGLLFSHGKGRSVYYTKGHADI